MTNLNEPPKHLNAEERRQRMRQIREHFVKLGFFKGEKEN